MIDKNQLPEVTGKRTVAKSALFNIEQIDLTFSNGEKRQYERMLGSGRGAVLIVPMINKNTMVLVREYCAGTHSYQLGFPKGLIDPGEQAENAANRELKEEIFFGADKLSYVAELMMAPAFFNAKMTVFLAEGLYECKLEGDEPEPLEIVEWPIADYKGLLQQNDFTEARSIAALMLVIDKFRGNHE